MKPSKGLSEFLRGNGLQPEAKSDDRGAAIHLAIIKGSSNHVKELLDLYPKDCFEAQDLRGRRKGRRPIHNAAQLGMRSSVLDILDAGADVNVRTRAGWTALMLAALNGQSDVVTILIQHEADVLAHNYVDSKWNDRKKLTALHVAAELKSPNIILQLLWKDANCDAVTLDGDTALHLAVRARCLPAAALLLLHGASIEVKDKDGVTAKDLISTLPKGDRKKFQHMLTCSHGRAKEQFLKCVEGKLVKPDLPGAIHRAVAKEMIGAIIYLLHLDPRLVDVKSERGWYPLHSAAKLGFTRAARTLLDHGAEINCLTKGEWTPVMFAADFGHIETLRALLEYHPNTLLKNSRGQNAALLAKKHGKAMVSLLPTFRHVPSNMVPRAENKSPGSQENLDVPKTPKTNSRDPSPARSDCSELEGELYTLSDATFDGPSGSSPTNPDSIEKLLQGLERTWYERIQWSPEDDTRNDMDWSGPVKIAILDTGIDLAHEDFQLPARRRSKLGKRVTSKLAEKPQRERIKAYRNFVGGPGEEEDVSDTVGHGTHIAGVILSIAPRAELYIAKTSSGENLVKDKKDDTGSKKAQRRTQRPVQEALQWAMDQGVDIINLSLGFPHESSYELTKTLEDANHKGIIVFAAAANHGNREAIAWPARDPDLAICVTSGNELNNLSSFAPSGNSGLPVFITHGEDFCSQWPTNLGGGFRQMTGTSVSTPVAVGMAAMILAFLNTTSAWSPTQKREWLDRWKERRLRSTRGMGRLLEHICRDRSGLKVLSPKLMWDETPDANPLQILSNISQAFRLPG